MTTQLKQWTQRQWNTPGISLLRDPGDHQELYGLRPTWDKRQLQRGPGWSAIIEFPVTGVNHIKAVRGAFYDPVNTRVVFIGHWYDGTNHYIGTCYANSAWAMTGPFSLITTNYEMGGLDGRNFAYWGGDLYIIDASRNVFRGNSYISAMGAAFYSGTDAWSLAPMGDRMYMVTSSLTLGGMVYRLNDADSAFELYFDPIGVVDFLFMAAFRGYMAIVAQRDDGTIDIYRLPDSNPALHHIAQLPAETNDFKYYGSPFAVHNDRIYLCPGRYTNPDGTHVVDVYEFNGSTLRRIARLPSEAASPDSFGLLNWMGELVYYEITSPGATATFAIKILTDDKFDNFAPVSTTSLSGVNAAAFAVGAHLIITTRDTEEGIQHHTGLQDGYVITAWLDMGTPGQLKVLEQITCLLDARATDFKVLLKYRTDDNAAWTTAVTANNTRRATVSNLSVEFYQLQLRIDLDDDSGGDQDIRINSISVLHKEY